MIASTTCVSFVKWLLNFIWCLVITSTLPNQLFYCRVMLTYCKRRLLLYSIIIGVWSEASLRFPDILSLFRFVSFVTAKSSTSSVLLSSVDQWVSSSADLKVITPNITLRVYFRYSSVILYLDNAYNVEIWNEFVFFCTVTVVTYTCPWLLWLWR